VLPLPPSDELLLGTLTELLEGVLPLLLLGTTTELLDGVLVLLLLGTTTELLLGVPPPPLLLSPPSLGSPPLSDEQEKVNAVAIKIAVKSGRATLWERVSCSV
jgi:hypothetical protein